MAGGKALYSESYYKNPARQVYEGSFETDDTGAPINVVGAGFSVGAPSTGVYTVTLTDGPFARVITAEAWLEEDLSSSAKRVQIMSAQTLLTTKAFTLVTQSTAGTAANLNGPRVNFRIVVSSSPVGK
jgi:hypothetical protein